MALEGQNHSFAVLQFADVFLRAINTVFKDANIASEVGNLFQNVAHSGNFTLHGLHYALNRFDAALYRGNAAR